MQMHWKYDNPYGRARRITMTHKILDTLHRVDYRPRWRRWLDVIFCR